MKAITVTITRRVLECPRCAYQWEPRKRLADYAPRQRCPKCFHLLKTPRRDSA